MRRSSRAPVQPLTARECATLDRIARDTSRKQIAAEFGISPSTVGNLAANAYRKLGVHAAAESADSFGNLAIRAL